MAHQHPSVDGKSHGPKSAILKIDENWTWNEIIIYRWANNTNPNSISRVVLMITAFTKKSK